MGRHFHSPSPASQKLAARANLQGSGWDVGTYNLDPSGTLSPSRSHTNISAASNLHHRLGNSMSLSHISVTRISSNCPLACAAGQKVPSALLFPSNSIFSSLHHTLPQAPRVFQVLQSGVSDQERWQCSRTGCITRPCFGCTKESRKENPGQNTHQRSVLPHI